jgi:hypothetical protein
MWMLVRGELVPEWSARWSVAPVRMREGYSTTQIPRSIMHMLICYYGTKGEKSQHGSSPTQPSHLCLADLGGMRSGFGRVHYLTRGL